MDANQGLPGAAADSEQELCGVAGGVQALKFCGLGSACSCSEMPLPGSPAASQESMPPEPTQDSKADIFQGSGLWCVPWSRLLDKSGRNLPTKQLVDESLFGPSDANVVPKCLFDWFEKLARENTQRKNETLAWLWGKQSSRGRMWLMVESA